MNDLQTNTTQDTPPLASFDPLDTSILDQKLTELEWWRSDPPSTTKAAPSPSGHTRNNATDQDEDATKNNAKTDPTIDNTNATTTTTTTTTTTNTPRTYANNWNLSHDAKLCSLLQYTSASLHRSASHISHQLERLEDQMKQVDWKIEHTIGEFHSISEGQCLDYGIEEEEDVGGGVVKGRDVRSGSGSTSRVEVEVEGGHDPNNTSIDLERLQQQEQDEEEQRIQRELQEMKEVEQIAIQDGIAALSLFHDPAFHSNEGASNGNGMGIDNVISTGMDNGVNEDEFFRIGEEEEEDVTYYECSPQDVFNSRPLPFVIGSKEFMESTDCGLG